MRVLVFKNDPESRERYQHVYEALSLNQAQGIGMQGLRKIGKMQDKLEKIGLPEDPHAPVILYKLLSSAEDEVKFEEAEWKLLVDVLFDAVPWHPMKARKVTATHEWLKELEEVNA